MTIDTRNREGRWGWGGLILRNSVGQVERQPLTDKTELVIRANKVNRLTGEQMVIKRVALKLGDSWRVVEGPKGTPREPFPRRILDDRQQTEAERYDIKEGQKGYIVKHWDPLTGKTTEKVVIVDEKTDTLVKTSEREVPDPKSPRFS